MRIKRNNIYIVALIVAIAISIPTSVVTTIALLVAVRAAGLAWHGATFDDGNFNWKDRCVILFMTSIVLTVFVLTYKGVARYCTNRWSS